MGKRFLKFAIVGSTGVVVDMAMLFCFADPRMLACNLALSKAAAAEFAIINNFIWNDLWTFRDLSCGQWGCRARLIRFAKFNIICLIGIALNVLIFTAGVRWLNFNIYAANLAAIIAVSAFNFWMNLVFGWGRATKITDSGPGNKVTARQPVGYA